MKKKMTITTPRIGFDRFIKAAWMDCAFDVRRERLEAGDLDRLLDEAALGAAARKKTLTVLKRLWLHPHPALHDLVDRCIAAASDRQNLIPLHWVMAVSAYPFFGKVSELVGKLTALQGDCTSAELHRRMSEIYGEREGTYRMTNMVLQTQGDWGVLRREGKRIKRADPMRVSQTDVAALLAECAVRHQTKPIAASSIFSVPVLYPFKVSARPAQLTTRPSNLELRTNSRGEPLVAVRTP